MQGVERDMEAQQSPTQRGNTGRLRGRKRGRECTQLFQRVTHCEPRAQLPTRRIHERGEPVECLGRVWEHARFSQRTYLRRIGHIERSAQEYVRECEALLAHQRIERASETGCEGATQR
jgi:hypothetical protein